MHTMNDIFDNELSSPGASLLTADASLSALDLDALDPRQGGSGANDRGGGDGYAGSSGDASDSCDADNDDIASGGFAGPIPAPFSRSASEPEPALAMTPETAYPLRRTRGIELHVHMFSPEYLNCSEVPDHAIQEELDVAMERARAARGGEGDRRSSPPPTALVGEGRSASVGSLAVGDVPVRKRPSTAHGKATFPTSLFAILADPTLSDVVRWMPHGRSWKIVDQKEFDERVLSCYFNQSKRTSFVRQVNGWGFRRIMDETRVDCGSNYHELFLRGRPGLLKFMRREPVGGVINDGKPRQRGGSHHRNRVDGAEPDFYELQKYFPLPATVPSPATREERKPRRNGSPNLPRGGKGVGKKRGGISGLNIRDVDSCSVDSASPLQSKESRHNIGQSSPRAAHKEPFLSTKLESPERSAASSWYESFQAVGSLQYQQQHTPNLLQNSQSRYEWEETQKSWQSQPGQSRSTGFTLTPAAYSDNVPMSISSAPHHFGAEQKWAQTQQQRQHIFPHQANWHPYPPPPSTLYWQSAFLAPYGNISSRFAASEALATASGEMLNIKTERTWDGISEDGAELADQKSWLYLDPSVTLSSKTTTGGEKDEGEANKDGEGNEGSKTSSSALSPTAASSAEGGGGGGSKNLQQVPADQMLPILKCLFD